MAIVIDHTQNIGGGVNDINVYSLVLARLQFLVDDAAVPPSNNASKISLTTY